ncbi:MAG: O-antigen ligase family protein [Chloroflexota bacterium]
MSATTADAATVALGRCGAILSSRRAVVLLPVLLVALGAVTPWSLLLSAPIVAMTLRRIRRWDGLVVGAGLLVAGSVVSLVVTIDLAVSLTTLAGIVGAFAVTVLVSHWWTTRKRLGAGLALYIGIACALVLLATIQVDIQFAKLNAMSQAVYGWFGRWPHLDNVGFSQNATAALIVAACPFSIALTAGTGRRLLRLGAALATLWFAFALILTLSRGAFFGLAIGVGAMIWLNGGRARWLAPLPTLLTLGLLLAGVTGYEFTISSTPTGWSSVDRLYIWHTALRMLADFPITGPGAGTFPVRMPAYTWPMEARDIPHAHNFLLQTYLDSGLVGLVGTVVLLLGSLHGTLRLLALPLNRGLRLAVLGSAGALLGTLTQGGVDAYFWGDARTFYVVALPIAVLLSVARLQGVSLAFPANAALTARLARCGRLLRKPASGGTWHAPRTAVLAAAAAIVLVLAARPIVSLALANSGNLLREHGELMATGSPVQTLTFAIAHRQLEWSTGLESGYGTAWQDLAEVSLDERNTSQAALYLARAGWEGQRDALVLRDDDRLSRLAIAQASPAVHAVH